KCSLAVAAGAVARMLFGAAGQAVADISLIERLQLLFAVRYPVKKSRPDRVWRSGRCRGTAGRLRNVIQGIGRVAVAAVQINRGGGGIDPPWICVPLLGCGGQPPVGAR